MQVSADWELRSFCEALILISTKSKIKRRHSEKSFQGDALKISKIKNILKNLEKFFTKTLADLKKGRTFALAFGMTSGFE